MPHGNVLEERCAFTRLLSSQERGNLAILVQPWVIPESPKAESSKVLVSRMLTFTDFPWFLRKHVYSKTGLRCHCWHLGRWEARQNQNEQEQKLRKLMGTDPESKLKIHVPRRSFTSVTFVVKRPFWRPFWCRWKLVGTKIKIFHLVVVVSFLVSFLLWVLMLFLFCRP